VFFGSVNLDPRSLLINTEMGVLIDDAALAEQATAVVTELMAPVNSWRLEIGPGTSGGTATRTRSTANRPAAPVRGSPT
jgi:putative cardiolipin synthase